MRPITLQFARTALASTLALAASASLANAQNLNYKIPPVTIPFKVKDQAVTITASGQLSMASKDRDVAVFNLELNADMSDLQQNMTALLSSALDKDAPCGDRIQIQNAVLTPADPAAVATVQLHYERWACVKLFGSQQVKKLIGGNAVITIKLTPGVDESNSGLRLVPEIGKIEADGSLGELLRAGNLGDIIRDKVQTALQSAMQKGTSLAATLPPAAQSYASITNAEFKDAGGGRLALALDGEVRIPIDKIPILSKQLKERGASR